MKKITLLFVTLTMSLVSFAGTGWFNDYLLIDKNGAGTDATTGTGCYWLNNPGFGTELNGADLGEVSTLTLEGCDMKYWDDEHNRTGGSFFYRITSADGNTEIVAPVETVWDQTGPSGNDYHGTKTGLGIDLLAGLTDNTTYKIHVWAKSWGGYDNWLNNGGSNYVATFTKKASSTPVDTKSVEKVNVTVANQALSISGVDGQAVQVYSLTGRLVYQATASTSTVKVNNLQTGIYIVKSNDFIQKVVVK